MAMRELKDFLEGRFEKNIYSHQAFDPKEGIFSPFPDDLSPKLRGALEEQGIESLYQHQREAFDGISENKDTLLVSSTASGKTLSFFLPVLNEYVNAKSPFSVLLLYPTKALSRDQEGTFGKLMQVVEKSSLLGTFDGDTPRDERTRIQKNADFVITNPDMLHGGVLPNHNRKWRSFLSRLRYIIIDEVHIYRGAFGSHVSNVFRRLLRVCEIHGSSPTFICSSATVGNPGELVKALFHRDFEIINKDTAPRPKRELYMLNPSLVQSHGHAMYRKGTKSISIHLLREAVKNKVRTICFCRSRQEVERLYKAVTDGFPSLKNQVKPYRGGLLPNERRKLEQDLVDRKITAIITTNALELGIDIGDLEFCILSGHPGSVASFWQQAGRVGRKGNQSAIAFIAKDSPIDQYMVHHSDFITQAPIEQAWLSADNPYIILQHLPCMAYEHPLRPKELGIDPLIYEEAVNLLREEKTVVPFRDALRYALQDYPAKGVNLRGMTDYNIEIYCGTEVIGEIDPIGARGTLYKDAIYQHLGRRYMSMELDMEKKLCRVEPINVDYYTEAHWEARIELTDMEESKTVNGAHLEFGFMYVNRQPKLYKKIRERTYENIGYGPITLPPFEYNTTGFSFLVPKEWGKAMDMKDKRYPGAALYGLSYLLKRTAPSLCMASTSDIDTDVSLVEENKESWKSALFMFDTLEGGVGYSEKIYEKLEFCLNLCREIIDECECKSGCPSCVPPLPPGIDNEALETLLIESNASIMCTRSLLTALIDGKIDLPEVFFSTTPIVLPLEAPMEDIEKKKVQAQLGRASKMLQRKREREH